MKETLQSPLLYKAVPKYSRLFRTLLESHTVFSWYSDIHECRALPVTSPTGIADISPSPCPQFLQTKKSESCKVVASSQKMVSSRESPAPSCSNRALTGSYWTRAPCGHGPHWDRESQHVLRWVADDAAAKGLASDSQGLFAFESVHTANIGKTKLARHWVGERD